MPLHLQHQDLLVVFLIARGIDARCSFDLPNVIFTKMKIKTSLWGGHGVGMVEFMRGARRTTCEASGCGAASGADGDATCCGGAVASCILVTGSRLSARS